ncbi:VOC family protein [Lysobacter sp. F6437]|uniref:VOC family protein n=1 Tax=Lysobacter sp. F6437 TaxID=3459296 RepID=UPI00403DD153
MQLTPYLTFKGDCEAAFKLYERVLGGTIQRLSRFGEAPADAQMPGADPDQVMHVSMSIGEQMLMGSDCPVEYYQKPAGTSVSISVDDRGEGERIFKALAEGGTEQMAYGETFWAEGFGMCVDRFGTPWSVNAGSKDPTA